MFDAICGVKPLLFATLVLAIVFGDWHNIAAIFESRWQGVLLRTSDNIWGSIMGLRFYSLRVAAAVAGVFWFAATAVWGQVQITEIMFDPMSQTRGSGSRFGTRRRRR